jgi:hypothetical protein
MTNDGKNIYQSDGTEKFDYKPRKPRVISYINVYWDAKIKALMS